LNTSSTTIGAVLNSDNLRAIPVGARSARRCTLAAGVSSSGTAGTANRRFPAGRPSSVHADVSVGRLSYSIHSLAGWLRRSELISCQVMT